MGEKIGISPQYYHLFVFSASQITPVKALCDRDGTGDSEACLETCLCSSGGQEGGSHNIPSRGPGAAC